MLQRRQALPPSTSVSKSPSVNRRKERLYRLGPDKELDHLRGPFMHAGLTQWELGTSVFEREMGLRDLLEVAQGSWGTVRN